MSRIALTRFRFVWTLALGALAACSEQPSPAPESAGAAAAAAAGVTVFTGARLLVGDGTVIDNATFTVGPDNRFGIVGATAAVTVPAGAATVDLAGLTVMPAIVDTHTHLSRDRAGLTADLKHRAYFGVSAAMSLGQDNTDDIYAMRREAIPGHALYRTAGRGFTAPEPGRTDIPYWITTAEEGRAGVREQAALGVDIIKVWVDDRMGQYPKLAPELYGAVIEEAHANGLRVTAHEYYLADAKELVRRGIDAFAHCVREPIDDEFVAMLKERPNFVVVPNLPDRGVAQDMSWLATALPAEQVAHVAGRRHGPPRGASVLRDSGAQPRAARARRRHDRARHRRQRAVGGAPRDGRHGRDGHDARPGHRRLDGRRRGVHAARRRRHRRARQGCELHRARGEPARRHHEHAPHSRRVLARRAHRSLSVLTIALPTAQRSLERDAKQIGLCGGPQEHVGRLIWPRDGLIFFHDARAEGGDRGVDVDRRQAFGRQRG